MIKSISKYKWPVIGNERIVNFLKKNIILNKLANAYLFSGPRQVGKRLVAEILGKTILCQDSKTNSIPCGRCAMCQQFEKRIHPDFLVLSKERGKKNISIEAIRSFQHEFNTTSLLGGIKIGIIDDAADLSEGGANALLKMLEEPAGKSIIILVTQFPNLLLPTIVSRCQILQFQSVSRAKILEYLEQRSCSRKIALKITATALGRPGRAIDYFEHPILFEKYEEQTDDFFRVFKEEFCYRFSFIQKYLGTNSHLDRVSHVTEISDVWLTIIRDILLYKENKLDQVIHLEYSDELKKLARSHTNSELLKKINGLIALQNLLSNNVNPRLALENYLINL